MQIFKKIAILLLLIVFLFASLSPAHAIEDPLNVPNNPFGIHILNESDLEDAAALVNSSGGDWGYVTLVIRKDERDTSRWQNIFNKMRRLHLIPIVRVATIQQNGGWEKPSVDEIDGWVSFFESLNWVTINRYIIIGNEPNHAAEWGGEINPEEYANYLFSFANKLKNSSPEYFVLPAGFDASAPTDNDHMSEDLFISRVHQHKPEVFSIIDGWTSHSYPNPSFLSSVDRVGRGSVRTFEWELDYLKSLGINHEFPVFITETGWAHDMGIQAQKNIDEDEFSERIIQAYNTAWRDERIVAITPFVLNYQDPPFDIFSWKKRDGTYYKFYYDVQKLNKLKGEPLRHERADVSAIFFPPIIPIKGKFFGLAYIKNNGQTIWKGNEVFNKKLGQLNIEVLPQIFSSNIEPGQGTISALHLTLGSAN